MASTAAIPAVAQPLRLVRVWFGRRLIASYVADAERAARYEQAMRRRFAACRVTNESLSSVVTVERG